MKASHPPKHLKPPNRTTSLFSCAFFRHCTDSDPILSPTPPPPPPPPPLSSPPPLTLPPPPLPRSSLPSRQHRTTKPPDSSSSSSCTSTSTSQSFTQWRFPPTFPHPPPNPSPPPPLSPPLPPMPSSDLLELFHAAEVHFTSGSGSDRLAALHMLERSLVPNPPIDDTVNNSGGAMAVPSTVVGGVVESLTEKAGAKPATKILLALCLSEGGRRAAAELGAASRVVDALPDLEGTAAERALAALDLMCTVPEGAAGVRSHALAIPMLVAVMARMEGRGSEYAISVLTAVYGGGSQNIVAAPPPEEVARAVVLAMQQGSCSTRARRKGAQLLKALQDINGGLDLTQDV